MEVVVVYYLQKVILLEHVYLSMRVSTDLNERNEIRPKRKTIQFFYLKIANFIHYNISLRVCQNKRLMINSLLLANFTGCSIPVVQVIWDHLDWVRFPAARQVSNE